jgi:2-keto-3-deoxy-L-rhamnonate aldolase RhmA
MMPSLGLAACVFRSVEMMAVARHAGFDFLVADMEHGAMSLGEAATLCVAGLEAGFPVHVRVPGAQSEYLSRVVDCGARGVIVPHVSSVEAALHVVDRVRFPRVGRRSIPSPLAVAGFRPLAPASLIERCEGQLDVAVMIEDAEALHCVEAIAAIEGIDTVMIGTNDLAQSLGLLGRIDDPQLHAAFARTAQAAAAAGKQFGVMGLPLPLLPSHAIGLGAGTVVVANDINLMFEAAASAVNGVRTLAGT